MRLSPTAQVLAASVHAELRSIRLVRSDAERRGALDPSAGLAAAHLAGLEQRLGLLADVTYNYQHEAGAIDPMTEHAGDLEEIRAEARDVPWPARRVVNAWLSTPSGTLARGTSLAAGTHYTLNVDVASADARALSAATACSLSAGSKACIPRAASHFGSFCSAPSLSCRNARRRCCSRRRLRRRTR